MLPHSIMRIMKFADLDVEKWFNEFEMFTTSILLFSHSCTFFVYYSFNSIFFSISRKYFRKICFVFYRKISVGS
jgi:hypothetical protein